MKSYEVTKHAIDRAVERLGRKVGHAKNDIIQRMQTARFQGETEHGRIFDHHESRSRFILAKDTDVVITCYPLDELKDGTIIRVTSSTKPSMSNVIIEKARAVIQREITKSQRKYTAEYRALSLEQAELSVEIAQANVKKVRCKAPHTQALIQERIDALQSYHRVIEMKLTAIKDEHDRLTAEAMAFVEV